MNWTVYDDKYASLKISETPAILDLKSFISDSKINCQVNINLADAYFWSTDRSGPSGARGPCGPLGPNDCGSSDWIDTRRIAEDKDVLIAITFTTATSLVELYKSHSLILTKNTFGETYKTWSDSEISEYVYCTYGVYKKSGFDAALNAIKVLKSSCTEIELAAGFSEYDDWDLDFVDVRLYDKDTDCIKTFTRCESVKTGKSNITLSLLACDLINNMDYIKKTLSTYQ